MKVVTQTTDEIVLKNDAFSVIMNFLFPLIFIVVGGVFVSGSLQLQDAGYLKIAGVLIVTGVLLILFSRYQTVFLFDMKGGKIIETKKRLIMSRSNEYQISDIQRVELRKKWHSIRTAKQQGFSATSSGQALNLSVVLVFKDSSDLLVDIFIEGSSSITVNGLGLPSVGKETQKAIDLATNIAQFLNVPFEEIQQ